MFACIYIPDFPVEAIVRAEPLLRERAVAVLDGKPPLVRIIALNEQRPADGDGSRHDEIAGGNFRLVTGRCPTRFCASARPRAGENQRTPRCSTWPLAFSPRVEDTADDRLLLDLAGLERLHGSAANMARELAARISAAGLEANVAVAANPDSAMHAACGFTGITVIAAGEEARRLGVLPLHVLLDSFDLLRVRQQIGCRARTRKAARADARHAGTLGRTRLPHPGAAAGTCAGFAPGRSRSAPATAGTRRRDTYSDIVRAGISL